MESNTPLDPLVILKHAQHFTGAAKDLSDAGASNAQRKLLNETRKHLPATVTSLQNYLDSETVLNLVKTHATGEELEYLSRLSESATTRDLLTGWAAVANAKTVGKVGLALSDMSQAVGGSARSMAASANAVASSADAVARSAEAGAAALGRISRSTDAVARDIHGIRVIGNSLLDKIDMYGGLLTSLGKDLLTEVRQGVKALTEMETHLRDHNSILVSGSAGPAGFAQHVYDFVRMRVDETISGSEQLHMFFVYHPDTNWWPQFWNLIRSGPLPEQFCAKSDDLDKLFQMMQHLRTALAVDGGDTSTKPVFHLLIPAWSSIRIQEPLHFPEALQPFRVEGMKNKGRPLVEFNLPSSPEGLLDGVANTTDPHNYNATAETVSRLTTAVATGWGVNGACLGAAIGIGAITGLGAIAVLPIWFGSAFPAMNATANAMQPAIYEAMKEGPPRILGSNKRLGD